VHPSTYCLNDAIEHNSNGIYTIFGDKQPEREREREKNVKGDKKQRKRKQRERFGHLMRQKSRNIDRSSLQYPGKDVNPRGQKTTVRTTPRGGTYEVVSQPRNHIASKKSHRFHEIALHRIYEVQHDHSQGASTPASPNKHHPQKKKKRQEVHHDMRNLYLYSKPAYVPQS
jgi:hypothetical protein